MKYKCFATTLKGLSRAELRNGAEDTSQAIKVSFL
jgi:hypothetical protein